MVGAVVTGASYRGLAVVRSLGRHGVPVHVVRTDDHRLALRSRYVRSRSVWGGDEAARVAHLIALGSRPGCAGWVLVPTHDEEAALVARHHDELSRHFTLTTPPLDQFSLSYDKRAMSDLADELGLARPWTAVPGSVEALGSLDHPFPLVIKPAFKADDNALTTDKAWLVRDAGELERRFAEAAALVPAELLMVQEWIPGGSEEQLSVAVLADGGEIVASLTARRTRQWPADFGRASTFVETLPPDPQLDDAVSRVIKALELTGIAEVEFKRAADGRPLLLDVNHRAWGWISLGASAGVDFPWLLYQQATGQRVEPTIGRPGVRWVRPSTDVFTALRSVRRPGAAARWLVSLRPPVSLAVFDRADPLPALLSPLQTAQRIWARASQG